MFTRRQSAGIYWAALLTLAFAALVTWLELAPRPQPLEKYRALPDFTLINQDGQPFTLAEMKGKVWLADFVYTTCPGPCPMISAHMARLQKVLPPDPAARILSLSTDPESDTPAVLKAYAKKFGALDRWTFLTGPKDQVYGLIRNGFMLPIAAPTGAQIIHSTRIMLVDKTGTVRGFYDGMIGTEDGKIIADMENLLRE